MLDANKTPDNSVSPAFDEAGTAARTSIRRSWRWSRPQLDLRQREKSNG